MTKQYTEEIPIYEDRKIIGWIDKKNINYYNIHAHVAQNVFRVGEATIGSSKLYIFDRSCFQWAEHQNIPAVLLRT